MAAAIVTTGGKREFVFYTSNEAAAKAEIETIARETKHHRILYVSHEDPEWQRYRSLTVR